MTACFAPKTPEVPVWVAEAPIADDAAFYGVSVAATYDEAVASATTNIGAHVFASAEPRLQTGEGDEALRRRIVSQMKTLLRDADFPDVTVKEHAAMDEKTAVMVQMPRKGYAAQLASRLRTQSDAIENAFASSANAPLFFRLGIRGKAYEERALLLAESVLLSTADPAADTAGIHALVRTIASDYNTLKFGTDIGIISDAGAIVYVDTMKKAFRAEGIGTAGSAAGTLLLYADSQQEHSGGSYHVKTRLRLVSTVDGKPVAQSERYLAARSDEGYSDAREQTAEALARIIKEEGLFHTLGF